MPLRSDVISKPFSVVYLSGNVEWNEIKQGDEQFTGKQIFSV